MPYSTHVPTLDYDITARKNKDTHVVNAAGTTTRYAILREMSYWSGLVWSDSKTSVMQGKTYARKAKVSAQLNPLVSCPSGRACAVFHFIFVGVDRVTAARTHVFLVFYDAA